MQSPHRIIQQGRRDALAEKAVAQSASEQRWAGRKASRTPALILIGTEVFGSRAAPLACLLRDTSSTGAKIELSRTLAERWSTGSSGLPAQFRLQIPSQLVEIECRIAWIDETLIGVQFTSPAQMLERAPRRRPKAVKPSSKLAALGNLFSK